MSTSPTQLTLKKLRAEGWTCAIVEHWNSFARIRQDLFGFGDILAVSLKYGEPNTGDILIVQCTTKSNMAARRAKIVANPIAVAFSLYHRVQVWGWVKVKGKWQVSISDLDGVHWQDVPS